jgi:ethanolamine utilization protein EutN
MRIAEVIGRVTLNRCHPALQGATWLVAAPLAQTALGNDSSRGRGEPIVLYDELQARDGSLIGVSEGAEASAPFYPKQKPIDAYNAAILDDIQID